MSTLRTFLLFLLVFIMFLGGCGSKRRTVIDQQEQEKRMEERYKESEKILEEARNEHYEMQNPETQKRMDETRRKSKEWNRGRPPFYRRWYRAIISLFE